MSTLAEVVAFMFPEADLSPSARAEQAVVVQDDGDGPRIAHWGLSAKQPSGQQLAAVAQSPEFLAWKARMQTSTASVDDRLDALEVRLKKLKKG